jgi:hypothetical protein
MTVEELHFQVAKVKKSARHEASSPGVKIFTTRPESHFQAANMMKIRSREIVCSSAKVLMTLK